MSINTKPANLSGSIAETKVSEYLTSTGYRIVARNWKTKACEIDIVAVKDKVLYFVEVKYRERADQGDGFDYITPKKLDQMAFAAKYYVAIDKWHGELVLSAASVSGPDFEIDFLEQV